MKKIITIGIEYPDCDEVVVYESHLTDIKTEALNILNLVEDVNSGRYDIEIEVTDED